MKLDWQKYHITTGNQFDAYLHSGHLKICCGGGTGFAVKCNGKARATELLAPLNKFQPNYEEKIIMHCNASGWQKWNYYEDRIIETNK